MIVYFVYGSTESGDDWSMGFQNKPSDEDIITAIKENRWLRDEYEAGCIQGWHVEQTTLR